MRIIPTATHTLNIFYLLNSYLYLQKLNSIKISELFLTIFFLINLLFNIQCNLYLLGIEAKIFIAMIF